jgi:hypothetical protein
MSNINPTSINGNYPIAGQDNDSQGFRDNFTNIVNNFTYAASEISALQSTAVTTSGTNNMGYNQIKYAQLVSPSLGYLDQGTASTGTLTFDYSFGSAQKITPIAASTVSFASTWPALGQYASLKIWIHITNVAYTLNLPTSVTIGSSDISGWASGTNGGTITFDTVGDYIFEFVTVDGGTNVIINDLSRNRVTLHNPKVLGNTITTGGFVDQGYQYLSNPSAGFWSNLSTGKSRLIIDATGTITSGNVTLPNVTVDGTIVSIHSTATVTTFGANTVQAGVVMRANNTFTLSAGTGVDYFYHLSENTWYKIR